MNTEMRKLQVMANKAPRLITGIKLQDKVPIPELLKQSKLPAANHMVSEQILYEAFRAFVTNVPMVTDKLRWRSDRAHESAHKTV